MKYLYRPSKPDSAAHLWDDGDTYCKMYSTGGLSKKKTQVFDDAGDRRICQMCQNVWKQIHEFTRESRYE